MDKIKKFLLKLSKKELKQILPILENILKRDLNKLDCKKLQNEQEIFRVRKGNIRIIFKKAGNKGLIINIDYRGNIYKKLQ